MGCGCSYSRAFVPYDSIAAAAFPLAGSSLGLYQCAFRASPLLDLPAELLQHIADFLQSPFLGHACRQLWRLLSWRYITCSAQSECELLLRLDRLVEVKEVVCGLAMPCISINYRSGATLRAFVRSLAQLRNLHTLSLCLRFDDALEEPYGAWMSHMAWDSERMIDSTLDILSLVATLPFLENVALELQHVALSCGKGLAQLMTTPSLRTLALKLSGIYMHNQVFDAIVVAPKMAQQLRTLSLDLSHTSVGACPLGLPVLVALTTCASLHQLHLDLCSAQMDASSAAALGNLSCLLLLHTVTINLAANPSPNFRWSAKSTYMVVLALVKIKVPSCHTCCYFLRVPPAATSLMSHVPLLPPCHTPTLLPLCHVRMLPPAMLCF